MEMATKKFSHEAPEEDDLALTMNNNNDDSEDELESDGDGSHSSSSEDDEEYVHLDLPDLSKVVQCAICLRIIRKTTIIKECLHRFCKECIEKSMHHGNNVCPTCRTHCPSRSSLRDDPNYDALIASIFPNPDKYEQENDPRTGSESLISSCISSFDDYFQNSSGSNDKEVPLYLKLDSLDEQNVPKLEDPHLICKKPLMSIKILCKYVALKTAVLEDEVELLLVMQPESSIFKGERTVDAEKDELRVLREDETFAELRSVHDNIVHGCYLVMAYKKKSLDHSPANS